MRASRRALAASGIALLATVCAAVEVRAVPGGVRAADEARPAEEAPPGPGAGTRAGTRASTADAGAPGGGPPPFRPAAPAPGLGLAAQLADARFTANALGAHAERIQQRLLAYRRWGLKRPLPARPAPPVLKPRVRDAQLVSRVPTDDKVIFLTVDDGAEKDPEFLELVRELDLPVTSFLTDQEARRGAGYDYFRTLGGMGGTVQNHTLHHPYLPALSYQEQRREICGQQASLKEQFGGPEPRLFRPPYGAYDGNTLRAARDCGLDAVVLWGMEAWAQRIDFQEPGRRLYPGAVILTHYRGVEEWNGSMADMTRRLLRLASEQGYTLARLEDYL
ncbi:polysaccharide deacetylase family protein [Streptomyces sp. N2-109]|uniref:Polysaccharide deacetylase family protein n=1 Tax=Streptomyces gossypii TaxID=2883101 RepID=A0ABT2JWM3_9ACTN|nr:polysaccharide deacetylase family protein [Streptomyces gossypii]MCT2592304.1 polysaccharide deacetylase family protein [Streptomyces gossypii]